MNGLRGYDGTIFWLNTSWLSIIAFLPVTSALYGDSEAGWAGILREPRRTLYAAC